MRGWWFKLNSWRWWLRCPLKIGVFLLVVAAVCFPYPRATWRHFGRALDPNSVIDPQAEGLAALEAVVVERLAGDPSIESTLAAVESVVYEHIAYAWDWDTWGLVDYLPTTAEVLEKGREDCDGRAVVAASLLRRMGHEAQLAANTAHVWVWTPYGEIMGAQPVRAMQVTEQGVEFDWRGLTVIPRSMAFGVAVFPWEREAIVLLALWGLLMQPRVGAARALACGVSLVAGLLLIRYGGRAWDEPREWALLGALACVAAGVIIPLRAARRRSGTQGELTGVDEPLSASAE
jgi:hypothetical protein